MDIISHGLWAAGIAKVSNKVKKTNFKPWKAFLWGVLPDLSSFGLPLAYGLWLMAIGAISFAEMPFPRGYEDSFILHQFPQYVYNFSHSLIIFTLVLGVVWLFTRKIYWEMFGALLHIFMDAPTHSHQFYPTPIFYPISDFTIDGISWSEPIIFIPNIVLILALFLFARFYKPKIT